MTHIAIFHKHSIVPELHHISARSTALTIVRLIDSKSNKKGECINYG